MVQRGKYLSLTNGCGERCQFCCLLFCLDHLFCTTPSPSLVGLTMKAASVEQKGSLPEKMEIRSKAEQYLVFGIHTLVLCVGLSPHKVNKETGEISFRWFSCETIFALIRLVVFNAPLSFLPMVLVFIFGPGEWKSEELAGFANSTSSGTTSTVAIVVSAVEYVSCYSYFILSKAAKKLDCLIGIWIYWNLDFPERK